jgi:hypothetical protein
VKSYALLFLTIRGILGGVPASLLNSTVAMPEPGTLLLLGALFATPKGRRTTVPGVDFSSRREWGEKGKGI